MATNITALQIDSLDSVKGGRIFPSMPPSVVYHATSMHNADSILRDGLTVQLPFSLTDAQVLIEFLRSVDVRSFDIRPTYSTLPYLGLAIPTAADGLEHYCKNKSRISFSPYDIECLKYLEPGVIGGQAWHWIEEGVKSIQSAVDAGSIIECEVPSEVWSLEEQRKTVQSQNGIIFAVDLSLISVPNLALENGVIQISTNIPKESILAYCEVSLPGEFKESDFPDYISRKAQAYLAFSRWHDQRANTMNLNQ